MYVVSSMTEADAVDDDDDDDVEGNKEMISQITR